EEFLQAGLELIAAGVLRHRARQMRERLPLDLMDEAARLPGRRNQVEPAACREMAALAIDRRHVGGDRIETAEVGQQPAVDAVGFQGRLNVSNIEPGRCRQGHPVQYSRLRAPGFPLRASGAEPPVKILGGSLTVHRAKAGRIIRNESHSYAKTSSTGRVARVCRRRGTHRWTESAAAASGADTTAATAAGAA